MNRKLLEKILDELDADRDNYGYICDEIELELAKPESDNKIIAWGAECQSAGRMYYTTSKDEADYWEREYGIIATKLYASPTQQKPLTEPVAWIETAKKLADDYAHSYAYVDDDENLKKHKALMDHLEHLPKQKPSQQTD